MNVLNLPHKDCDVFAARIFTQIKKGERYALVFWLVCLSHALPFLYLKITYPRDRIVPKPSPKIILWTAETTLSSVQAQMDFIQTFRDPSVLMLPEPYQIGEAGGMPSSRLLKLEPTPNPLVSANSMIPGIKGASETLSERANAALNPRLRRFIAPSSIQFSSVGNHSGVIFAASINDRLIKPSPSIPPVKAQILNQTSPTQIRLAIDARGLVRHALVVMSSGSDALDKLALEHIRAFKFSELPEAENSKLTWGEAKFFWVFESSQQDAALPSDS
jgi:hypothetical protein